MAEPQSQPPPPKRRRPRGILLFLAWVGAFIGMDPGFKPWEPEEEDEQPQEPGAPPGKSGE